MIVSQDVMDVLDKASCEGNALFLSGMTLDRQLYMKTNKVIKAAGGKWNKKAKAHLFPDNAAESIEPILLTGTVVLTKQEFQQFDTPAPLAELVIKKANIDL